MKVYALIGGLCSGKSTVAALFRESGAVCVDLDEVGRGLYRDEGLCAVLAETFGSQVRAVGGGIDRAALARAAFESGETIAVLNGITHPLIVRAVLDRLDALEAAGRRLVLLEISAFDGPEGTFSALAGRCDGIIAVTAPESLRLERALARGFSQADAESRMAVQPTDEQRLVWADFVLDNVGGEDSLRSQVRALLPDLTDGRSGEPGRSG